VPGLAAIRIVAGSPVTIVGVVLGVRATSAQPSELGGVISAAENLLASIGGDLEHAQVIRPGAVLGSVSGAWTAGPAAVAAAGFSVTGWPGTPVIVTVTPRPLGHAISQGQPVARATVTIGSQVSHISLDASQAAPAPSIRGFLTRLFPGLAPGQVPGRGHVPQRRSARGEPLVREGKPGSCRAGN
jgi:hypothetical protein